jgi:hypothetical protein
LAQIAGVGYVVKSFMLLVAPVAPELASIALLVPAFVADLSLALGLLIKGVDASRLEMQLRSVQVT